MLPGLVERERSGTRELLVEVRSDDEHPKWPLRQPVASDSRSIDEE